MADISLRRIKVADAPELAEFHRRNRDFLAPFDPVRPESYYHVDGLRERIERAHADEGDRLIDFIVVRGGDIVGKIALSNVSRGAFQNANVGYSIDEACNGCGYATIAVKLAVSYAFGQMRLHRVEAGTLLDNVASQRVLEKAGFTKIGISPRHLRIDGAWRDHMIFARVAND